MARMQASLQLRPEAALLGLWLLQLLSAQLALGVRRKDFEEEATVTAVILEPRCHPALPLVVANLHQRLPEVPVTIFYSQENEAFVKRELQDLLVQHFGEEEEGGLSWLSSTPLPGVAFEEGLRSPRAYSDVLVLPSFWERLTGEHVLVFQTDSWVCENAADKLDRFLAYDYVGAPSMRYFPNSDRVGNGGLSLRTRKVMIEAAKRYDRVHPRMEDVFFGQQVAASGALASDGEARQFSAEEYPLEGEALKPFGVHKVWKYHEEDWSKLLPACPGLDLVHSAQDMSQQCGVAGDSKRLLHSLK